MYLANYESPNFSFIGVGRTKNESKDALMRGLKKHADQYNLEEDWYLDLHRDKESFLSEICFIKASYGDCIKDNEVII